MELPLTKLMGGAGSEGNDEEFRCYALSLRRTQKGGWVVGYNRRWEFGVGSASEILHSSTCILLHLSASLDITFEKVVCTVVYLFCRTAFHGMNTPQFISPFHFLSLGYTHRIGISRSSASIFSILLDKAKLFVFFFSFFLGCATQDAGS